MSDILCIYYSRTGHTRRAMEEVADALGAEVTAITDDRDRNGWRGYIRCGMDAMKTSTRPLLRQPRAGAAEAPWAGDEKRGVPGHAQHLPAQRGGL